MPKKWTTKEQATWLKARVKGFNEVRCRHRGVAYARSVHTEFSKLWPEREALYPTEIGAPKRKLTEKQKFKVKKLTKRRSGQILSWLQRNGYQRGRTVSKAVKVLMRSHRKRRRAPQPVEAYAKLFPEKVNAEYLSRKGDQKLTNGKRLSLLRKIASEFLAKASDEVLDAVAEKQEEMRRAIEQAQDAEVENLENTALEQYVEELPSLLTMIIQDIRRTCSRWGFLLLAAGPIPNSDKVHVFDIYDGPTTTLDYGIQDVVPNFDQKFRQVMGQFMQDRHKFLSQEKAADELKGIKMSDLSSSESDVEAGSSSPVKSTKPPKRAPAQSPSSNTSSDSDSDSIPPRAPVRRPANPTKPSTTSKSRARAAAESSTDSSSVSDEDSPPTRPPVRRHLMLASSPDASSDADSDAPAQRPAARKVLKKHPVEDVPLTSDHIVSDQDEDDVKKDDKMEEDDGGDSDEWGGIDEDDEWGGIGGSDNEGLSGPLGLVQPSNESNDDMKIDEHEDVLRCVKGSNNALQEKSASSSISPVVPPPRPNGPTMLITSQPGGVKPGGTAAERRAESTRRRLETLRINKEARLAAEKAQEEVEKAKQEVEKAKQEVEKALATAVKKSNAKKAGNRKNAEGISRQSPVPDTIVPLPQVPRDVESAAAPPIHELVEPIPAVMPPPPANAPKRGGKGRAEPSTGDPSTLNAKTSTDPPPTRKRGAPKGAEKPLDEVPLPPSSTDKPPVVPDDDLAAGAEGDTPHRHVTTSTPPPTKRKRGAPKEVPPSTETPTAVADEVPAVKRPRRQTKPPPPLDASVSFAPRARGKRA